MHDIVRFARSQGILCQGRGSAANSVVCYCLGITSVDPEQNRRAVRALYQRGARRAARYRRRFRARAAARRSSSTSARNTGATGAGMTATVIMLPRPQRCARRGEGVSPARSTRSPTLMGPSGSTGGIAARSTIGQLRECGIDPSDFLQQPDRGIQRRPQALRLSPATSASTPAAWS